MSKEFTKRYEKKRYLYHEIKRHIGKKIFLCVLGPRGVGKTVLLRQIHSELKNSFYISLDSVILERSLFEIAKDLETRGVKILLLDDVHFAPNFQAEVKKYSIFLTFR